MVIDKSASFRSTSLAKGKIRRIAINDVSRLRF
jgi:hypothetical protein